MSMMKRSIRYFSRFMMSQKSYSFMYIHIFNTIYILLYIIHIIIYIIYDRPCYVKHTFLDRNYTIYIRAKPYWNLHPRIAKYLSTTFHFNDCRLIFFYGAQPPSQTAISHHIVMTVLLNIFMTVYYDIYIYIYIIWKFLDLALE